MKERTTRKHVVNFNDIIIKANYCSLQHLLSRSEPMYYTAGVYGWNADVYINYFGFESVAIVTGYRPFGYVRPSYQLCKFYDDKAAEIIRENPGFFETQRDALDNLTRDFIGDALKEAENRKKSR